jgi:hypothetical protein
MRIASRADTTEGTMASHWVEPRLSSGTPYARVEIEGLPDLKHFRNRQIWSGISISQLIFPKVIDVIPKSDCKFLIALTKAKTPRPGTFSYRHNFRGFRVKITGKERLSLPYIDVYTFSFAHCLTQFPYRIRRYVLRKKGLGLAPIWFQEEHVQM